MQFVENNIDIYSSFERLLSGSHGVSSSTQHRITTYFNIYDTFSFLGYGLHSVRSIENFYLQFIYSLGIIGIIWQMIYFMPFLIKSYYILKYEKYNMIKISSVFAFICVLISILFLNTVYNRFTTIPIGILMANMLHRKNHN